MVSDFRHTITSVLTLYEIFVSWCQTLDTPLHQFLLFMKSLCHGARLWTHHYIMSYSLYEMCLTWCQTLDKQLHQFLLFVKCL